MKTEGFTIGQLLKAKRWDLDTLVKKSGINKPTLENLLERKSKPHDKTLRNVAEAFGMKEHQILWPAEQMELEQAEMEEKTIPGTTTEYLLQEIEKVKQKVKDIANTEKTIEDLQTKNKQLIERNAILNTSNSKLNKLLDKIQELLEERED